MKQFATIIVRWVFAALIIASIISYDSSIELKIILAGFLTLLFFMYMSINQVSHSVDKVVIWARLTFISSEIRNERKKLLSAQDRLEEDISAEKRSTELSDRLGLPKWVYFFGGVVETFLMGVVVFLILHFDVLDILQAEVDKTRLW